MRKFAGVDENRSSHSTARLAQSVERKALNLVVVGSSPTVGVLQITTVSLASYAPLW